MIRDIIGHNEQCAKKKSGFPKFISGGTKIAILFKSITVHEHSSGCAAEIESHTKCTPAWTA